jgi:hypothetical protein
VEKDAEVSESRNYRRTGVLLLVAGGILLALAAIIGITDNVPGIVSMLAGLFAVALGIIYFFATSGRRTPGGQLLYWSPRALCIVYTMFLSMFAMDVFNEGGGFFNIAIALFMHLIPNFLLVALLVFSWRREWIAGSIFPVLGLLYIVWSWNKPFANAGTLALIAGPLFLTGALFLVNWFGRERLRGAGAKS